MPSAPKEARLVNVKENIKEQIGFALHLRLRDQRWEVKDSALEFVARLVKSRSGIVAFFVISFFIFIFYSFFSLFCLS